MAAAANVFDSGDSASEFSGFELSDLDHSDVDYILRNEDQSESDISIIDDQLSSESDGEPGNELGENGTIQRWVFFPWIFHLQIRILQGKNEFLCQKNYK